MKTKLATLAIIATFQLFNLSTFQRAHAAQYSKFEIVVAAKQAGKWDALKAWIDNAGYSDEWLAVEYLIDSDPQFAAITNAVVVTGIATAEEVAAILSAAKDTAPDALLTDVYGREIQSEAGRTRWHGKCISKVTDVEAWEWVYTYEDGFVWREKMSGKRPGIDTNEVVRGVSKRLAEARLRRLAEAAQTNVVDVVIEPDAEGDAPLPPLDEMPEGTNAVDIVIEPDADV